LHKKQEEPSTDRSETFEQLLKRMQDRPYTKNIQGHKRVIQKILKYQKTGLMPKDFFSDMEEAQQLALDS
jgi:hypothetical protein